LYKRLNPDGPEFGFMALNVSVMDQAGCEPDAATRSGIVNLGLLPDQIRALVVGGA
jgi:hypothetical protein